MIVLLFFAFNTLAQEVKVQIISYQKHTSFKLGIGSKVNLQLTNTNQIIEAIFLGRMVDQENRTLEYLFLNELETKVLMVNPENVEGLKKSQTWPVISPIEQMGSTCTAYGFLHFWDQIYFNNTSGNDEFKDVMRSDRKRMQFLEETIDHYYLQNRINITNVLKKHGKRFGFACRAHRFKQPKEASQFLFEQVSRGIPVLIDFNIGSDMVSSSYEFVDFETNDLRDPRLWIPRKVGQRSISGHVIVAAGAFISKGKKKLLVLDSNWSEPRVWDLQRYIENKAAVKEMGFHSCY